MPPIRVLNIITRLEQGGAPLALLETVKRMDREAFDLTICAGKTEDGNRDLDVEEAGFDLPVISVPSLRRSVHPLRDLTALAHLIRVIRSGKYDVVHTHTSKAGLIGRIAAWICRVPAIVHSSHGTILQGYFSSTVTSVFSALERFAASLSHRIICLTNEEIGQYLDANIGRREQYSYIFNGIDLEAFEAQRGDRSSLRSELGYESQHVVCVTAGRLVPVKGQADLLDAFAIASEEHPDLRLLIIGDGELRDQLKAQSDTLGISEKIQWVGWRDDVAELLDASDVFVLTSLNEGLGLVLIEAMAKRLPVVATSVGGIPEVVDDGVTGTLVPVGHPEAIANAITELSASEAGRKTMGERGYTRAHRLFSIDHTVENTQNVYREVLASRL